MHAKKLVIATIKLNKDIFSPMIILFIIFIKTIIN